MKRKSAIFPLASSIVVDWSRALIQAVLKIFNHYLEKVGNFLHSQETDLNWKILHICSSLLVKAGINRIKQFTSDEGLRGFFEDLFECTYPHY